MPCGIAGVRRGGVGYGHTDEPGRCGFSMRSQQVAPGWPGDGFFVDASALGWRGGVLGAPEQAGGGDSSGLVDVAECVQGPRISSSRVRYFFPVRTLWSSRSREMSGDTESALTSNRQVVWTSRAPSVWATPN